MSKMALYCKGSVISLIILMLHQAGAKPSHSSQLQAFADFLNNSARQLKNNTTESQLFDENANKVADPLQKSWLVARRNLENYGAWLEHFSSLYAKKRTKPFARVSRGRLDRMPLSYGKRSTRGHLDSEDKTINLNMRSDNFDRFNRARLERMPLSFGKRSTTDADFNNDILGVSPVLSRQERGTLDRMPIAFGKREEALERATEMDLLDRYFSRKPKDRIDRMPITFGKRGDFTSQARYNFLINLLRSKLNSLDLNGIQASHSKLIKQLQGAELPLIRSHRSRLGRMPLTFGKRSVVNSPDSYGHSLNQKFNARLLNIQRRSRMDRMPLSFGKRSSSDYDLDFMKRHRMARMPMAYGKRKSEEDGEFGSFVADENDLSNEGTGISEDSLDERTDPESTLRNSDSDNGVNQDSFSSAYRYLR